MLNAAIILVDIGSTNLKAILYKPESKKLEYKVSLTSKTYKVKA